MAVISQTQQLFRVKLNYVVGSSGETAQRMTAEKDSGKAVASVVTTGDSPRGRWDSARRTPSNR